MSITSEIENTAKNLIENSASQKLGLPVTDKFNTSDGKPTRTNIEFTVQHEGYWFGVHADQEGGFAVFRIHAILGQLPFTFQSSFARTSIMAVVRGVCKHLKARFKTDEHQRIILIHEVRAKGILHPKIILTETTKVLLQLKPYLQLITALQPPRQATDPQPDVKMEDYAVEKPSTE